MICNSKGAFDIHPQPYQHVCLRWWTRQNLEDLFYLEQSPLSGAESVSQFQSGEKNIGLNRRYYAVFKPVGESSL
jgi:hypothetical protein